MGDPDLNGAAVLFALAAVGVLVWLVRAISSWASRYYTQVREEVREEIRENRARSIAELSKQARPGPRPGPAGGLELWDDAVPVEWPAIVAELESYVNDRPYNWQESGL